MSLNPSLPEVSLITSWRVVTNRNGLPPTGDGTAPIAMWEALQDGIGLLDLYFLDHHDIPWYHDAAGRPPGEALMQDPHRFVASLNGVEIKEISDRLSSALTDCYSGKLVGRRPRFTAIATYFPNIGFPDEDVASFQSRQEAVKALRNTLYLAHCLGCRWVEIVAGAAVPGPKSDNRKYSPIAYRTSRRLALARSLEEIFAAGGGADCLDTVPRDKLPGIAIELEPGASLLMNSLQEYVQLKKAIKDSVAESHVGLNVDIAHAFLLGYSPQILRDHDLVDDVAHMHLSDHAGHFGRGGAHASDLAPDIFHRYDEYEPWLQFAIECTRKAQRFSGAIAIEMEACNDPDAMHTAVNITRRWLRRAGERMREVIGPEPGLVSGESPDLVTGAILVVDIGNSTDRLVRGTAAALTSEMAHCVRHQQTVENLCKIVHESRGSVMSFTGDGLIAIFEEPHFTDGEDLIRAVLQVAAKLCACVTRDNDATLPANKRLTGRVAVHWGHAYIPSSGRLRDQIIGEDVVLTARICDWLRLKEIGQADGENNGLIAISEALYDRVSDAQKQHWASHSDLPFKGFPGLYRIFIKKS